VKSIIVTGTDTGVGKTMVAAMLTLALDGIYWKPIQSGTDDGTDRERVAELTQLPPERFRAERYRLSAPLSPHRAAELDGVAIALEALDLPVNIPPNHRLIIEGAGGVLVPVTREYLQIELFSHWRAPVVVVARTALGTINHTLLTLEALRRRDIAVLGIIFVGDANADNERTIAEMGKVRRLGRLPFLPQPDKDSLLEAFHVHFNARDFEVPDFKVPDFKVTA
jgi:dethiobiotin synthetase